ncbi:MAG: hypothetical protein HYV63_19755 [Candidatus Schekmanbacteria bacterium]|nr:hypothetical protein [Candidatus Schekmanbacteria bacterium]
MQDRLVAAYILSSSLLICHEVDAAVWAEWEMFALPGGAPTFVALHLPIAALALYGLVRLARQHPSARWYGRVVASVNIGAAALHAAFLVAGDSRFRHPLSLTLLGFMMVVGIWHLRLDLRCHSASA